MNVNELTKKWRRLDPVPFEELSKTRKMVHEAVQLLASAAISFIPPRKDDSHTNCEWSRSLKALVGNVFGEKNNICLGLNIAEFKILLLKENWTIEEELQLHNKSIDDVIHWMQEILNNFNVDFSKFTLEKHYDIQSNKVFNGGKFFLHDKYAFQELSDYYTNADLVLRSFISGLSNTTPVRCWPHHFDIATLLNMRTEKLQSIGVGLSPGDINNRVPYFYVTMWPYPDLEKVTFKKLPYGHWNLDGWIGSALDASEIVEETDEETQVQIVSTFIDSSVNEIKSNLL